MHYHSETACPTGGNVYVTTVGGLKDERRGSVGARSLLDSCRELVSPNYQSSSPWLRFWGPGAT